MSRCSTVRRSAPAAGVGALGLLLLTPPAGAASVVGLWHLNERPGATRAVDSSAYHNHGQVLRAKPGVPGVAATAYRFGLPSVVKVPDAPSLDPGTAPIAISIWLRTTARVGDWNLLQKGRIDTAGGNYKIEIAPRNGGAQGAARCYFRGSAGTVLLAGGPDVSDGRWHHVVCTRSGSTVRLQVDGTVLTRSGATGSISNATPLTIGAKGTKGADQYLGDLDEVQMTIG